MVVADKKLRHLQTGDVKLEHVQEIPVKYESVDVSSEATITSCPICGAQSMESSLLDHVRTHLEQEHTCNSCQEFFGTFEEYRSHVLKNHKNEVQVCPTCHMTFQYRSLYDVHVRHAVCGLKEGHQSLPDTTYKPIAQEKTVKREQAKNDHDTVLKRKQHLNLIASMIECEICGKKLLQRGMKHHMWMHQRKPCHICGMLITITNLDKHITTHTGKPLECELCGKVLKNQVSYRSHKHYVHGKRGFQCDDCGKVFSLMYTLQRHKKTNHGGKKTFVCEICSKSFFFLTQLNSHKKITHQSTRDFVCTHCSRGYPTKNGLRSHLRQHTNETPYRCEVCGEGFKQNVSLRAHRKSKHNIVEPLTCFCELCGKGFSSEHALKSHMVRQHDA